MLQIPYLLSILIFLPLLGALLVALAPREWASRLALLVAVATFLLSLLVVVNFEPIATMQFVERAPWITALGGAFQIEYFLGLDGLSLWLVPLTTLLTALSVWFSSDHIRDREKGYYAALLALQTGMLGVFLALDLFLFFVFWEAVLIPMYFLIGIWGGQNRLYATIKFVLFTMAGSALMLAAIIVLSYLAREQTQGLTFALDRLLPFSATITGTTGIVLFLAFALAFAIKVPLFPFHTWLPDAHVQAPTAGSVLLAGVLLKMGTYGFLRFAMPLFPEAARAMSPVLAILALIGIIYGAVVAYGQRDIKSLVAYSSVSHLGFVMLGIFAINTQGFSGSVLQMVNHGLSTGALFFLVGMIYERRHTRDIDAYGGLWKVVPLFSVFFLITMLASVGLPGLNGFVGEFLTLLGAFLREPWWAAVGTFGVVLAAAYLFKLFGKLMFGPITNEANRHLPDLTRKEVLILVPLVVLMILIGFAPNLFLLPMEPTLDALVQTVNQTGAVGLR